MKLCRIAVAGLIIALGSWAHTPSFAAPILVTSRAALAGDDLIDWAALGPTATTVANPFAVASDAALVSASVSMPAGAFMTRQQTADWFGNFAPGNALLWTMGSPGPLVIAFDAPVAGAGAQIQPDVFGAFTAHLAVFDSGGNLLSIFSLAGDSHGAADDSALFLGVRDSTASIGRIQYSVEAFGLPEEFAINRLDVLTTQQALPEPGMPLIILGAGLLLLLTVRAEKKSAVAS